MLHVYHDVYIYIYVYTVIVYIYIYIHISLSLYIYICIYVCIYTHMYDFRGRRPATDACSRASSSTENASRPPAARPPKRGARACRASLCNYVGSSPKQVTTRVSILNVQDLTKTQTFHPGRALFTISPISVVANRAGDPDYVTSQCATLRPARRIYL